MYTNDITFNNTSTQKLTTAAKVAIPFNYPIANAAMVVIDGQKYPLVFEKDIGTITKLYSVIAPFNPGRTIGTISEIDDVMIPFKISKWVAKNPFGTIFRMRITKTDGSEVLLSVGGKLENTTSNTNLMSFDIESPVVEGFKLKQVLTIYRDLDHVEFKLALNWHDRADPSYLKQIAKIRLESNDEFVVHFKDQMQLPNIQYHAPIDTWVMEVVPSQVDLRDGNGFDLRGYILAMPENFISFQDLDAEGDIAARVENLQAVRSGRANLGRVGEVTGLFNNLNYENNWFNRHLPELNINPPNIPYPLFLEPGVFGVRCVGSAKMPGQTGAQQDFGSDKGFQATVFHNADYLTWMKAGQTDRLRVFNIHEPNGSKVIRENHPGWKTWNMETFDITSTDTLGKAKVERPVGTGWLGYDNQHRSMNNITTYYALTGDEITLDTLINAIEADIAQSPYGQEDREVGRMFNCWARLLRVLPPAYAARLKNHITAKIGQLAAEWRGRFPEVQGDLNRTVRVNKVILDPRSGVINPSNGRVEPSWIAYQHAQMCQGIYTLSLEMNDSRLTPMLKDMLKTFLWHGCFKQGDLWYTGMFIRYRTGLGSGIMPNWNQACPEEGLPLNQESYRLNNWEISVDIESSQGWWNWVGPAVAIAKNLLDDQPSKDRANEILTTVYPNGLRSIESAEWYPVSI
jgi:hypothetical protein